MPVAGAAGLILASAVVKEATTRLGAAIGGEIKLRWKFYQDLQEMKDTLESIEAVLQDAERRSFKDASARLWLRRLMDAADDITTMLDVYEAKSTSNPRTPKLLAKIFCFRKLTKMSMAKKMKKMRHKLNNIAEQRQNYRFKEESCPSVKQIPDKRETWAAMEPHIVERTDEKEKLISRLSHAINQEMPLLTILPIYGIGGIGKTTLAKQVFSDARFKDYSQVWVYVSQMFDLRKIGNIIISEVLKSKSKLPSLQMVKNQLGEILADKKILIVLDDLWETDHEQLDKLKAMLNVGNGSNVIAIVTTRYKHIAHKICTVGPYKIPLLTNDMCWDIIKLKIKLEARPDKDQLETIGREIASKCGGLALAAQTLGYMLESRTFGEWESVRDNEIWDKSPSGDISCSNVIASLMLSYNSMPSDLKLCFAYCATFPKGHQIVKDDLIYQWISLGLIEPPNIFSTWQLGENYVSHLMGMSFLQYTKSHTIIGVQHREDVTVFTMHDVVHDLARGVMVDDILDASKQGNTWGSKSRFALLDDCTKPLKSFTQYPTKIRALRFLESDKNVLHGASSSPAKYLRFLIRGRIGLPGDVFSSGSCLRVLDLSECSIQKLPNSIGSLKQLRYLNAPRVQHWEIPNCITKLSKLIYLNICGSSAILALPESFGEMEGLMYLDLSGCSCLEKLPDSFGKLTKLAHLDLSDCSHVTRISESLVCLTNLEYLNLSYCSNIGKLPEHLGSLLKLRNLNLSYSSYIQRSPNAEVLATLTKLVCLNLSSELSFIKNVPEALSKLTSLKYLNLSGFAHEQFRDEWPTFGNLKNLEYLDLSECYGVDGMLETLGSLTKIQYLNLSNYSYFCGPELPLAWMSEAIGNLTELRYLNLSYCSYFVEDEAAFTMLLQCISNLLNLEHLDLSDNFNLTSLPDCLCRLKKLHTLDLSSCKRLKGLPAHLDEMDSLKFLMLDDCDNIHMYHIYGQSRLSKSLVTLPDFVVQADCHDSSSSLVLLQDVNHTHLMISKLENVKSAQEAWSIKLTEKVIMKKLDLNWTEDAERTVQDMVVLGELVPPITLEELQISGYNSVRFPEWFVGSIASHLPNLVRISMSNLSMCSGLPQFGQLPNLEELNLERMDSISKIDWEICGTTRPSFPRLQRFTLCKMGSLKVWYTNKYSRDGDCAREFMFPNLRVLEIKDCPNLRLEPCPHIAKERWEIRGRNNGVISSWGEGASQIDVSSPSSAPVSTLRVRSCEVPMHQWRLLHHLPGLTELEIYGCRDLSSSPKIMQALSTVQWLTLCDFDEPEPELELPNWLGQLASLKKLTIRGDVKALQDFMGHLTRLQSLCLEYITSMTELPQWVGDISLQQLQISCCPNLNDLTESIGGLTSLKELAISDCDGITSLPETMQQLTKLEKVEISYCKELLKWWETEENKTKLAYIKEKIIW